MQSGEHLGGLWTQGVSKINLPDSRPELTHTSLTCAAGAVEANDVIRPRSASHWRLPTSVSCPSTTPRMPLPVRLSMLLASGIFTPRRSAATFTARERGWVENRASAAAAANSSSSPPTRTSTRSSRRFPSVSVPVLSIATTRTFASRSIADPPRKSTPRRAAEATAERIAEGTDNTSAQGDITTRRVMAR